MRQRRAALKPFNVALLAAASTLADALKLVANLPPSPCMATTANWSSLPRGEVVSCHIGRSGQRRECDSRWSARLTRTLTLLTRSVTIVQ